MDNAAQLKHSMKYLGLTGVDLARKLTAFREDGRKTAPETVSRWLTGKVPIDAGVMAWIDQSVRFKACRSVEAMVTYPSNKKSLVIGFANIKNDFSTSLLAIQLGAVSTQIYRCYTTHVVCEADKNRDLIRDRLRSLWIGSLGVSEAEIYCSMRYENHLYIQEFSSNVWECVRKGHQVPELDDIDVDVLLTPIDCNDPESVETARAMLSIDSIKDKVLLVHTSNSFDLGFIGVCQEYGLDTQASYFYPSVVHSPSTQTIDLPDDPHPDTPWPETPSKKNAEKLLQYVVKRSGGEMVNARMASESILNDPLPEVLKRLWRDCEY